MGWMQLETLLVDIKINAKEDVGAFTKGGNIQLINQQH